MAVRNKPLLDLTAGDLMTREVVRLPETTPLRDAARLLLQHQIAGAPVVAGDGRCVGVLSAVDILRRVEKGPQSPGAATARPVTCPYLRVEIRWNAGAGTRCTLPPGVCPVQETRPEAGGEPLTVCGQPACVLVDARALDRLPLPDGEVRQFMTADPVTVAPDTALRTLARMMVDAHIHRLIVVDGEARPVGVVSSTDLLAALAFGDVAG